LKAAFLFFFAFSILVLLSWTRKTERERERERILSVREDGIEKICEENLEKKDHFLFRLCSFSLLRDYY
jgi:hypothetical protein